MELEPTDIHRNTTDSLFKNVLHFLPDAVVVIDGKNTIIFANERATSSLGYAPDAMNGLDLGALLPQKSATEFLTLVAQCTQEQGTEQKNARTLLSVWTKDGNELIMTAGISVFQGDSGRVAILTLTAENDSYQQGIREETANRLYAFISAINQTIIHATDEPALLQDACKIAVEIGKFDMAFFGRVDANNKTLKLWIHSNATEADIAMFGNLHFEDSGAIARLIRDGRSSYINNYLHGPANNNTVKYSLQRGFKSGIVLPIRVSQKLVYTFNLFSSKANLFDDKELTLLDEISADISYALDVIASERLRREAESRLRHSELRLKQAQRVAKIGHWELSLHDDRAIWSEEHCRIYGLDKSDNRHSLKSWLAFVHPDDLEFVSATIEASRAAVIGWVFDHRIIVPDGTIKYIHCQANFEFDGAGNPVGLYGVSHDITDEKKAEEQIIHTSRLYAFISQINQAIIHSPSQPTVFREACRIAIEFGKFHVAWIGAVNEFAESISLINQSGMLDEDISLFANIEYEAGSVQKLVIESGKSYICNDIQDDPLLDDWKHFTMKRSWRSSMTLPIKKGGKVVATFNIVSRETNFFNEQEKALLEEATGDISFALDFFENDRQRKESEKKLLHSELRLKQAQSIAHIGSWELNFETGVGLWSEEACKIYGLSPDDDVHSYKEWEAFIHPDDLEFVLTEIAGSMNQLRNLAFSHRIVRKNGAVRYLYSQASFDFNEAGKPIGLFGAAHDITEARAAEAALARSESNLRLIMNLIPQSIFAKDKNGRFIFVNKSFASLYGMAPETLVGKNIADTMPAHNDSYVFGDQDKDVMETGQSITIPEQVFTDYKGNVHIFHTVKVPFTVSGSDFVAVLGISNDITEQKNAEAERLKMIADIVQRNKDLEQFSYIVSHNLRAPVANICGLAEILMYSDIEKSETVSLMNDLLLCVTKLDEVIIDLNHILQVKAKQAAKKEMIRFSGILNDILLSIDTTVKTEEAIINSNFSEVDELETFRSYLYSIFLNLITNSLKYRQTGKPPEIDITSYRRGGKTGIIFRDNGIGFDLSKNASQVFGLYKRFHDHVDGKGMGLFMVKTQVESLGGKITVESEVNKGTTFNIEFDDNSAI